MQPPSRMPARLFQDQLQSERVAKNLEEGRERVAEDHQERKEIGQEEHDEREQERQELREERKRKSETNASRRGKSSERNASGSARKRKVRRRAPHEQEEPGHPTGSRPLLLPLFTRVRGGRL